MKKKFSLLLLALVLVVAMAVPAFARTELKDLEDGTFEVTFTYADHLDAAEMYLAGDMNGWKASHPDWKMHKEDGVWKITKTLEKGVYAYKFVGNGSSWYKDPNADTYQPDGFGAQNSVVKVMSNALKGQFKVSGQLTNTIEQKGFDAPLAFNNDLYVKVSGTGQEKVEDKKIDRLKYTGKVHFESNIADIAPMKSFNKQETLSLDLAEISFIETTYLGDLVDVEANYKTDDNQDSYDYLGLYAPGTGKDNAADPNGFGDMLMLRANANKYLDANVAFNEYENRKFITYANARKDLKELTGQDVTVGGTALMYQPKLMGKEEFNERAIYSAVFGEYKPMSNMTVKAEYAYVPTGNIDQNTFTIAKNGSQYTLTFNLQSAIDSEDDFEDMNTDDYDKVVLIGEHNGWTEDVDKDYKYELENTTGNIWEITVSDQSMIDELNNNKFKVIGITDDEEFHYAPSGLGGEKTLTAWYNMTKNPPAPLEDGMAYLAEANYKFVDQEASMQARIKAGDYSITKYKGEVTAGAKGVSEDAYLKVADDDFADVSDGGEMEYYVNGNYDLTEDLTVDGEVLYKTQEANTSEVHNQKVKAGMDWKNPVAGLDNVKGHIKVDPEDTDDFDGEVQELFAEAKTSVVPGLKFIKANTTQRLDSEANGYYVETELDVPVEQIAHVKGNLFYADNKDWFPGDNGLVEDAGLKFFVEGKVHHLTGIEDYVTHVLVNYESDEDGIIDNAEYDDDDNDWKNKIHADTKFNLPAVNDLSDAFNWDGLFVNVDLYQPEDGLDGVNPDKLDDVNKDDKYYVAEEKTFVNWYSILGFETGMDLPLETRVDAKVKYDMNHGEISEYEDDAIKIDLEKKVNMRTSITASYNKQDSDEGEDYSKLTVETIF